MSSIDEKQRIDVWAQLTTPRMAEAPWMATLLRWTGRSQQIVVPSVASTLDAMNGAGVEMALLSAWHGPDGSLISNEEVAGHVAAFPERFRGIATVDIRKPGEAASTVRTWVSEGFVGVRIVPWLWGLPPNHRLYYPVYAACVDAGVPLCTQIGHTGPLRSSESGRLIPYLEDVLLDFPDLVVVGGHVGYPWLDEVVSMTHKFPNFYVDTSAYTARRLPPAFVEYMKGPGDGRVMFGTNWPMISPDRCLSGLENLGLTEAQEASFLVRTARRVFGIQPKTA